jgi:hypothetical protein
MESRGGRCLSPAKTKADDPWTRHKSGLTFSSLPFQLDRLAVARLCHTTTVQHSLNQVIHPLSQTKPEHLVQIHTKRSTIPPHVHARHHTHHTNLLSPNNVSRHNHLAMTPPSPLELSSLSSRRSSRTPREHPSLPDDSGNFRDNFRPNHGNLIGVQGINLFVSLRTTTFFFFTQFR